MKVGQDHTLEWGNWFRPTPKNVLRISMYIQDILIGASTITVFTEANKWVSIGLSLSILVVRAAVKFLASVVEETESVTTQFPSGEQVTITHEVPESSSETKTVKTE